MGAVSHHAPAFPKSSLLARSSSAVRPSGATGGGGGSGLISTSNSRNTDAIAWVRGALLVPSTAEPLSVASRRLQDCSRVPKSNGMSRVFHSRATRNGVKHTVWLEPGNPPWTRRLLSKPNSAAANHGRTPVPEAKVLIRRTTMTIVRRHTSLCPPIFQCSAWCSRPQ